MNNLDISDFVYMEAFEEGFPIKIDLVYSDGDHPENIFKTSVYRKGSKLWLHKDLAKVVLFASEIANKDLGYVLVLKDGLRTVDAQEIIYNTDIVQSNPHWTQEGPNRLLSPPGKGAHPRGMAIDLCLMNRAGEYLDMGTPFDYLSPDPGANPAHRNYKDFPDFILQNRAYLKNIIVSASYKMKCPLIPLDSEWWDFRYPAGLYEAYEPLYDKDLPYEMRMTDVSEDAGSEPIPDSHLDGLNAQITGDVRKALGE
jgi:D-alanyl-D-alanine dipeptidase